MLFHHVDRPSYIYDPSVDGYLGCFHLLAILGNTATHLRSSFCVDVCFHVSWVDARSGIVGRVVEPLRTCRPVLCVRGDFLSHYLLPPGQHSGYFLWIQLPLQL